MANLIKKDTLAVYKGSFKNLLGLQGSVMEDTPSEEGFIWMDFGNKRVHRVAIPTLDFTDVGVVEKDKPVVKQEETVEIDTGDTNE